MNIRKNLSLVLGLITVICFGLLITLAGMQNNPATAVNTTQNVDTTTPVDQSETWPTLQPAANAAPNDIAQVKAQIERSYDLIGMAARTFDVSQFYTVYVNDPSISLSTEQADYVKQIQTREGNTVKDLDGQGMLAFWVARFTDWKRGAENLEQLQAKAEMRGQHALSGADVQALKATGQPVGPARRTDVAVKTRIRFDKVIVNGSQADVVFDDGEALVHEFLVKTKDGWKIAGMRPLNIHF
jgi:hypothetical protein